MIRVQNEDFSPDEEIAGLTGGNHDIGAIVSFIGTVRDIYGGEDDSTSGSGSGSMTLEHYPGMTEKMLARIEAEARERWPLEASLIIHRVGRLQAGDRIVLVVTASRHRKAAFQACEFLMDWLKTRAPFWKLEEDASGQERWVNADSQDQDEARRWEAESIALTPAARRHLPPR